MGLTVLSSFAEVISLSATLPFIGILTRPEKVFDSPSMADVVKVLGITSSDDLVLPLTIAFAVAAVVAGVLRLLLLWVSIRLGNAAGADLSIEVYRRTLYQSYSVHVARSSSEIISGITQKVGTATGVLISVVALITSAMLFAAIMMTLLAIDPMVAIIAAVRSTLKFLFDHYGYYQEEHDHRSGQMLCSHKRQSLPDGILQTL
jgi:ATP-binding cassette, subfamily B, bacterial PglK